MPRYRAPVEFDADDDERARRVVLRLQNHLPDDPPVWTVATELTRQTTYWSPVGPGETADE